MSAEDDLLNKNTDQKQDEDSTANGNAADVEPIAESRPDRGGSVVGQGLAADEIRVVEPPARQGSSSSLVFMLLLLIVLLGAGYYLISGLSEPPPQVDSGQQQTEPQRYAIDKQVQVEVVAQPQVATVAEIKTSAPEKPAVVLVKKPETAPVAAKNKENPKLATTPRYQVLVGPYLSKGAAEKAAKQLRGLGYTAGMTKGRGKVSMTRLLEGVYHRDESRERLRRVKERIGDAFLLPTGDKWAIYVGSFTDAERAAKYVEQLAEEGVNVTPITSAVEMNGRMLIAAQAGQQAAKEAAAQISAAGLTVQIREQ